MYCTPFFSSIANARAANHSSNMFLLSGSDLWQGVISRREKKKLLGAAEQKKKGQFVYDHITLYQSTESIDANAKEMLDPLIPISKVR